MGSMLRRLIGENIHLAITPAPSPARVLADAGQLEQVIMNLAVNARDAMPTGGQLVIEVSTRDLNPDQASRFDVRTGRYVLATVGDTGHGMDPATLSRVFEPFFTTKPSGQGTGLGLATTYGILRQSGGGIAVESEPGTGSTFSFCLPSAETGPEPAPDAAAPPAAGGSEHVLLVEDDPSVRRLEGAILRSRGYVVIEAASGEEAVELLMSQTTPIHIMLSDVVMPGMGGRDLAERVTSLRPGTKVLLMSGYTDDPLLQVQIRDRIVAFLQKPYSPDALARKVREVLDSN
jgi:CheY-like chemotaxis protein